MNVISRERFLQVAEVEASSPDLVALLGRDIRTAHEVIADYCVTEHLPIYEDLAVLVESMAYMDRAVTRHRSVGWSRDLSIQLPVHELSIFRRRDVAEALADAALFLTGDRWNFDFIQRKGSGCFRQSPLPFEQPGAAQVIPYSDGLDSFAQVKCSVQEHGRDAVLLVRAGLAKDKVFPQLMSLRVPRQFQGIRLREVSYRTRPLIFFTFSAIAAHLVGADVVVIGENGQGSFGAACLPFADEWWFRSTHPAFVVKWANVLSRILGKVIRFEQPNLWKTKGQVLTELRDKNLTDGWDATSSCSTRPADRMGSKACGVCGGCLLRIVSALSAGLTVATNKFTFDVRDLDAKALDREGNVADMSPNHRDVAVRAITVMEEFAKLLDSPLGASTINREARLVDDLNPSEIERSLADLLRHHRSEWTSFKDSLPTKSWLLEIVGQL